MLTVLCRWKPASGRSQRLGFRLRRRPSELSFNARYLLDITDQISGEMAELSAVRRLTRPLQCCSIRGTRTCEATSRDYRCGSDCPAL
jgi:hypothetical protein